METEEFSQTDHLEMHEEQPKGKYIPTMIWRLYDDTDEKANRRTPRIITAEEMMLLTKINSLAKREQGCTASNKWLGKWWDRSPHWVSESVSKFKKLGIIKIKYTIRGRKTQRQIWTTFEKDSNLRVAMKPQGSDETTPMGSDETTPMGSDETTATYSYDTSYHIRRKKEYCGREVSPGGSTIPPSTVGFFPSKEEYSPFIQKAVKFLETKIRIRHKLNGKRIDQKKWCHHIFLLLQDVENDTRRVKTVMTSFFKYPPNEFSPQVESAESFRRKFANIERWVAQTKKEKTPLMDGYRVDERGQLQPVVPVGPDGWTTVDG